VASPSAQDGLKRTLTNTSELPIIRPGWAGMPRFKNSGGEQTIVSESPNLPLLFAQEHIRL
jgi:hypothetical protein